MHLQTEAKLDGKYLLAGHYFKAIIIALLSLFGVFFITNAPFFAEITALETRIKNNIPSESAVLISQAIILLISLAALVVGVIVVSALKAGRENWFWNRAWNNPDKIRTLFLWFKPGNLGRAVAMRMRLIVRRIAWSILFLFPSAVLGVMLYVQAIQGSVPVAVFISLVVGTGVMFLVGLFFLFVVLQRYFAAYYILADNKTISARKAISESTQVMEGKYLKTLRFKLSFIIWFFLCVFILPIFYVYPYYKQSCACLSKSYIYGGITKLPAKPIIFGKKIEQDETLW